MEHAEGTDAFILPLFQCFVS